MLGAAAGTRDARRRDVRPVSASPGGSATMQPFCAPLLRRMRVSLRVSMSAMATVPSSRRYCASVRVLRKFDARSGRSRTIRPAAWTLRGLGVLAR